MAFRYISAQSGTVAPTLTFPAPLGSYPGEHVVKLMVRLRSTGLTSTCDALAWGDATRIDLKYKDGSDCISQCRWSTLDFLARENKSGMSHLPLDLPRANTTSTTQAFLLEIPFTNPKLRNPMDSIIPIDELGTLQMSISSTGFVTAPTSWTAELYAETAVFKNPHLGLRTKIREFGFNSAGEVLVPCDGNLLDALILSCTLRSSNLQTQIPAGLTVQVDGRDVVMGTQLATPEMIDCFLGEPVYQPLDASSAGGTSFATGQGLMGVQGQTASGFARIFRTIYHQSLVEMVPAQLAKITAFGPGAGIASVYVGARFLQPMPDSQVTERRQALGYAAVSTEIAPTNGNGNRDLKGGDGSKLPRRLLVNS